MKKLISLLAVVAILTLLCCSCGTANNADTAKVKVVNIPLSEESYAFCVNKADAELLANVNAYLAQIKQDGTFDSICDNYFGNGTPASVVSAVEDASKDQLVVATSTGFEPFEMVDGNGVFSGIDLEIADGLAKFLGKELVIKDMQFEAVVTSVESGLCDIGMAGLTITPARQEVVTFSDSYYSANQMLVIPGNNTEFDACKTADDVVAILNAKTADCKIGCQKGTTGAIYITGDIEDPEGYGFAGLPATKMEYDYAALAFTAMINGEVDFVIVDDAPANAIAKAINQ